MPWHKRDAECNCNEPTVRDLNRVSGEPYKWEPVERENRCDWKAVECDGACDWAISIYQKLNKSLESKEVVSWFKWEYLHKFSLCKVERGCCKKRKLMLAMTSQILDWLKQHQHELSDIDFGDDEADAE